MMHPKREPLSLPAGIFNRDKSSGRRSSRGTIFKAADDKPSITAEAEKARAAQYKRRCDQIR